ncbi:secreted RxLR effector protein 161-like [Manihot esculenta]|uniref:secreted RxLR effector protein 161-like n=1 Tax=Manihot esculenta TaxID=3983 RepID=UPI001CC67796|nr:secreted RxLR effector protein 161-like [Manihot esculenta]
MSALRLLHYFLILEVKQVEDEIFMSQRKYAIDLLKRFNMLNCKTAATPTNLNEKLHVDDGIELANASYFIRMVGGLIYLTHTRLDIAFSVGVISKFIHYPSKHYLGVAKRFICYIVSIVDFGLWYTKAADFRLSGFSDSDWAGCLEDRRSTSGYMFKLGSATIYYSSKKQSTTALSSLEAEYVAVTLSTCQEIWLRILTDL